MRLFLASQDLGNHVSKLHELVNDNKKTLVIFNARDYVSSDERKSVIARKRKMFEDNGFVFTELDLRNYFQKPDKLETYIDKEKPGLIFAIGGNYYILMRAFVQSGFDNILKDKLLDNSLVYGGASAGSMIATPDLRYYNDQKASIVPEGYGSEVIWDGLHLIDEYISPHFDDKGYNKSYVVDRIKRLKHDKKPYLTLKDSDVLVINNSKREILR